MDSVYLDQGYSNRQEYLKTLCDVYPSNSVYALADLLGEEEDFDGLVVALEDRAREVDEMVDGEMF